MTAYETVNASLANYIERFVANFIEDFYVLQDINGPTSEELIDEILLEFAPATDDMCHRLLKPRKNLDMTSLNA
jgi:hypothetical protein